MLGHAELARLVKTPICLDESITSARTAAAAIRLGACSIINIKPGRVGGYLEARRIHDVCRAHGDRRLVRRDAGDRARPGGELALAALPGFTLPGDTSASDRYYKTDITEPFVLSATGTLTCPPGLGSVSRRCPSELAAVTTWTEWVAA